MTARDVIEDTVWSKFLFCIDAVQMPNGSMEEVTLQDANGLAQDIIEALTAAGYRIIGPGEVDRETVELRERLARMHRRAQRSEGLYSACLEAIETWKKIGARRKNQPGWSSALALLGWSLDRAVKRAAIRSLTPTDGGRDAAE